MAALREHLDLIAVALHRATVLRLGTREPDEDAVRASDAHLPAAGWVVGIAACVAFALFGVLLRATAWGALVAAIVATSVSAMLTRGRAETALFRTAERLQGLAASGQSGAGALVLLLVLAARLSLLAAIASFSQAAVLAALFAAQVVSRLSPLLLARSLGGDVAPHAVRVALAWCVVPLLVVLPAAGIYALLFAVLAAVLACYGAWRLARVQADPVDRDLLAASQQVCELAFYLGIAIGF